jgi:DNA polymerase/3'-5' exonuclease PolX
MKGKLPIEEAESIASRIAGVLMGQAKAFRRVEIAGSIRRRKPLVGDIELVGEIDPELEFDATSRIKTALRMANVRRGDPTIRTDGVTVKAPWGDRYLKGIHEGAGTAVQIDLFVVRSPAEWGPVFLIRTGSAEFSQAMVTRLHRFGLRCEDGRILKQVGSQVERVPCGGEERFFELVGLPYLPPEERDIALPNTWALVGGP